VKTVSWLRRLWQGSLYRQVAAAALSTSPALGALLGILIVGQAAAALAFVLAIGAVVGHLPAAVAAGSGSSAAHHVEVSLLLVAAFLAAQHVMAGAQLAVAPTVGRRLEGKMRARVMNAAMAPSGISHLDDPAVRASIEGATTLGTSRAGPMAAVEALVPMSTSLLTGAVMAGVVAWWRWWLGVALLLVWLMARTIRRRDNVAQAALMSSDVFGTRRQAYFRQVASTPDAAKEIRVFGLGEWLVDRFHRQWVESVESMWAVRRERRPALALPVVVLAVVNVVAFVIVGADAWTGRVGLRSLTVVLQAIIGTAVMAEPGATVLVDTAFVQSAASMALVPELEAAVGLRRMPSSTVVERVHPVGDVVFHGVSFKYQHQSRPVLEGLDLTLPAGRSVALVGENGAGKTTIVKLLCGLLEPTAGSIMVGDATLGSLDPQRWRASLAVVFQDFAHLRLTARENVAWGAIDGPLGDDDLAELAAAAGIAELGEQLARGWDTPLTRQVEGGTDLSGGQWQRVALGRALWSVRAGASVLVMDEPTANLDVRAEAAFYARFLELTKGLTTVVISHRFATVRQADTICLLDAGRITESGSHEELVAGGGAYAHLFRLQAAGFQDNPEVFDA
jgi:ATP-binding cassette subfamily B protein